MKTVKGPIAPLAAGTMIYQITLASGMIITNPAAFGLEEHTIVPPPVIVGENGQVLTKRAFQDAIKRVSRRAQPRQVSS